MNDTQHGVTGFRCFAEYPHAEHVVDLVEFFTAILHVIVDGIEMLGPGINVDSDFGLAGLPQEVILNLFKVQTALFFLVGNEFPDLIV